jgi:hypothetical protein
VTADIFIVKHKFYLLESSWLGYCKLVSECAHIRYQTRHQLFPLGCLVVSLLPLSLIPLPPRIVPMYLSPSSFFPFFTSHSFLHGHNYKTRVQEFSEVWEPPQRSGHRKSDIEQVQHEDLKTFGTTVQNLLTRDFRPSI